MLFILTNPVFSSTVWRQQTWTLRVAGHDNNGRNGRNTKRRQYGSATSTSVLFLIICLPLPSALGSISLLQQCRPSIQSFCISAFWLMLIKTYVLCQNYFFAGPENILRRTMEQFAEAYGALKHVLIHLECSDECSA